MSHEILLLNDWMTTEELPFHSKITEGDDHNVYHTHDFYEIFYVLEGSIDHDINGEKQTLHVGDMVFTNPKDVHSFFREPGNTCKHRDIIIRTDFFQSICRFIGENFLEAYESNQLPKIVNLSLEQIERYEHRITNVILTSSMHSDYRLASMRSLCVSLLNNLIEEEIRHDDQYYPMWFRELLARFHMNEFLKTGLDEILQPFHFSKSYICRTFHKYLGCTMTDYLNDVRLQQAAFLLQYTDETILTISSTIGFSSVSYFNNVFKKKYRLAPSTFRKKLKNTISA